MINTPNIETSAETDRKVEEKRAAWAKPELRRMDAADAEATILGFNLDVVFS